MDCHPGTCEPQNLFGNTIGHCCAQQCSPHMQSLPVVTNIDCCLGIQVTLCRWVSHISHLCLPGTDQPIPLPLSPILCQGKVPSSLRGLLCFDNGQCEDADVRCMTDGHSAASFGCISPSFSERLCMAILPPHLHDGRSASILSDALGQMH